MRDGATIRPIKTLDNVVARFIIQTTNISPAKRKNMTKQPPIKDNLKERLSFMKAIFKQDGSWLADLTGECKLYGGEIPHGHASYCDMWKMEKEIQELKQKLAAQTIIL